MCNTVFGGDKMKLELYDDIHLNREIEELSPQGIHSGCLGTIMKLGEKRSLVLFYNPIDIGDYAFAWVANEALDFFTKPENEAIAKELAKWFVSQDPAKKLSFEPTRLRELDQVRVAVEKPKYAKEGVHKGMVGTILDPRKLGGDWLVFFADETGADTIGILIQETDLELIHHSDGTTD